MALSRNQLHEWANGDREIIREFERLMREVEDLRREVNQLRRAANE